MKEKIERLYFAKCRYCIMDMINNFSFDGQEITPRPDYVDYYTIIKKKDGNSFIDLLNKNIKLVCNDNLENTETYYNGDIILSLVPLSYYIKSYDSLNIKECVIALEVIKKAQGVEDEYGYINNKEFKR